MDNMNNDDMKLFSIILILRKLGYTKDQINKGIKKIDETKYTEINISEIVHDIIKNIEEGDK